MLSTISTRKCTEYNLPSVAMQREISQSIERKTWKRELSIFAGRALLWKFFFIINVNEFFFEGDIVMFVHLFT